MYWTGLGTLGCVIRREGTRDDDPLLMTAGLGFVAGADWN